MYPLRFSKTKLIHKVETHGITFERNLIHREKAFRNSNGTLTKDTYRISEFFTFD
jgi:hypothetical protein